MPDYVYLLENRLSADQQHALLQLRAAAREAETILFLTGDAVRDLTSGQAVRDFEVAVHGSALKLKKIIKNLGATVWGEDEASRSLYLCFPGTVRVDLITTHRMEYPKPGKGVFHSASIQEDLRRRDFTVNAMALSLNEGSFGLLMDPLNGVADLESKTLRLVSNYGFLEDPALLIRATRYLARLGWEMDPKTQTRYENAKAEGVIEHLSDHARSQELEQIGHEEDGLKVLGALEAEGWMKVLYPAWTVAKADEEKLIELHQLAKALVEQGVHPDMSAAQMQLLTAKMAPRELAGLKKLMLRPGFVEEWSNLDAMASKFAKVLLSKENASPSAAYKLFMSYDPEAILWLGFTSDNAAVQERFNEFLKVWPEVRQRIPHALLQEMRITPELPAYREIIEAVFLELIDGRLTTAEDARAFLEPHSPPAPPPHVSIKKPRGKRGAEARVKEQSYDDEEEQEDEALDGDLDDIGADEEDVDLGLSLPKASLASDIGEETDSLDDEVEEEPEPAPVPAQRKSKPEAPPKPAAAKAPVPKPEKAEVARVAATPKPAPKAQTVTAPSAKPAAVPSAKPAKAPAPAVAAKAAAKPVKPKTAAAKAPVKAPVKTPVKTPVKSLAKHAVKVAAKPPAKTAPKPAVKVAAKRQPAHSNGAKGKQAHSANSHTQKPVTKKPAAKPAKKR